MIRSLCEISCPHIDVLPREVQTNVDTISATAVSNSKSMESLCVRVCLWITDMIFFFYGGLGGLGVRMENDAWEKKSG